MTASQSAQTTVGPDGKTYPICSICNDCVFHRNPALDELHDDDDDSDEEEEEEEEPLPEYLLDDIFLEKCPNQHHFHWECITSHKANVDFCPACVAQGPSPSDQSYGYVADDIGQVHATVTTAEGGTETGYDIKPAILEEQVAETDYTLNGIRQAIEELAEDEAQQEDDQQNEASGAQILNLLLQKYPLQTLVQALFEASALGDMTGVLELVSLMPTSHDIYNLVNQPLTGGSGSSSSGSFTNSELLNKRRSMSGWTPIFEAIANGRSYVVNTLLTAGANPDAQAVDMDTGISRTPAQYALDNGRQDIAVFIQAHM